MFTGIVTETGRVKSARLRRGSLSLEIEGRGVVAELKTGDSVAVNGVCLTATAVKRKRFTTEAVPETLSRTTLGELTGGTTVNLELPARLVDRLGGHLVQGHVDAVGRVISVLDEGASRRVTIAVEPAVTRYMVEKGSVAIDGVSLTVARVQPGAFDVALIPHTLQVTTLGELRERDQVNVEIDVIAKYVERLMNGDG